MNIQSIINKIDFQRKIQLTKKEMATNDALIDEYSFLINEFLPELRADLAQVQKDSLSHLDRMEAALAKLGISV